MTSTRLKGIGHNIIENDQMPAERQNLKQLFHPQHQEAVLREITLCSVPNSSYQPHLDLFFFQPMSGKVRSGGRYEYELPQRHRRQLHQLLHPVKMNFDVINGPKSHLTQEEKDRRQALGLCKLYGGINVLRE